MGAGNGVVWMRRMERALGANRCARVHRVLTQRRRQDRRSPWVGCVESRGRLAGVESRLSASQHGSTTERRMGAVGLHGMGPKVDGDVLEHIPAVTESVGAGYAVRLRCGRFDAERWS